MAMLCSKPVVGLSLRRPAVAKVAPRVAPCNAVPRVGSKVRGVAAVHNTC